jgi:UDP-glucuronate 4-epimerase
MSVSPTNYQPSDTLQDCHIVVTGGAGFIGSTLTGRLLREGARVTCIDSMTHGSSSRAEKETHLREMERRAASASGRCRLVETDIRNEEALREVLSDDADAVVHLAALAGVRGSIDEPQAFIDINERGTMSLLRAVHRSDLERVILASSSSVYGRSGVDGPCHETQSADAPTSPYAASKRAMEMHGRAFGEVHDLSISVLRFFTVYGPRQRPDMAIRKFMDRIYRGEPLPLYGDGTSCRCYTYIDDLVDGIVRTIPQDDNFRVYNLGGEETVELNSLVDALDEVTDRPVNKKYLPEQPGDVPATRADIRRARDELGYAPKTRLKEGLHRMWAWLCRRKTAPSPQTEMSVGTSV